MKGINPLLIIIVIIAVIILFAIFANTSTSITGLATGLSNLSSNVSMLVFGGTFNQSLNTSDSVIFKTINVTGNVTIREGDETKDTYLTLLANQVARDSNIRLSSGRTWELHSGNLPDDNILAGGFTIWDISKNNYPFTINTVGKIGINTTSQTALLDINSSNTLNAFRISSSAIPNIFIVNGTSGNVGVGTNSLDNKLTVAGNMNVTGFINVTDFVLLRHMYFTEHFGGQHFIQFINNAPTETNGGQLTFLGQTGGIDNSNGAGTGGAFIFTGGTGGAVPAGIGTLAGTGGDLTFNGGTGGASADGSILGGVGGILTFNGGTGGANTGGGSGGNGGVLVFNGGTAGSGGNRAGGNLFFVGGVPTGTGAAGNIILGRTSLGTNRGKILIATSLANGDVFRVAGNSTFDGNISSPGINNRMGLNSPIARNYSLNTLNINASSYSTNGSDYAESVPKLDIHENITSGDIVGIYPGGKASKNTVGAFSVMVVSGNTIGLLSKEGDFLENYVMGKRNVTEEIINTTTINILNLTEGNITTMINETVDRLVNVTYEATDIGTRFKNDFTDNRFLPVAFAGQVPVKISGLCAGGNWVIPSGLNDGLGKCVDPKAAISIAGFAEWVTQKVCIAWENKETIGVGKINCAVMGSN